MASADQAADEAQIRAAVDSYVQAYNAGDAKALAEHWGDNAVYESPVTGEQVTGRAAIEDEFRNTLEQLKGSKLSVDVQSIEFVSPSVAIEYGIATVVDDEGEPSATEYSAVHVKQGDKWRMDRVTEKQPVVIPSQYEHLQALEWLVGTWVDEDDNARVETSCSWAKNQNFLTRTFTIELPNEPNLSGVQIIGWDPQRGVIRSWTFDSDGGFAEGTWKQKGDHWIVENSAVLPDGRTASSLNTLKLVDENTFKWQITGRDVDGEILPNLPEVTISRSGEVDSSTAAAPSP
jgi:uncharacterized protein (TIGR02246 family)